jgi:hypothetical protein
MIAEDLHVSPEQLEEVKPMWKTPEWEQAVKDGSAWVPILPMSATASGSMPPR